MSERRIVKRTRTLKDQERRDWIAEARRQAARLPKRFALASNCLLTLADVAEEQSLSAEDEWRRVWAGFIDLNEALPIDDHSDHDEDVLTACRDLICKAYGHRPEADQCDIPDHDACVVCGASTPDQAPGRCTCVEEPYEDCALHEPPAPALPGERADGEDRT